MLKEHVSLILLELVGAQFRVLQKDTILNNTFAKFYKTRQQENNNFRDTFITSIYQLLCYKISLRQ